MTRLLGFALLLFACAASPLVAQELPPADPLMPEEYDPSEFPLWTQDVRRYEVVTIGSFPIAFFLTSLIYDFALYAESGWDSADAMGNNRDSHDIGIIVGTAVGVSLGVATADLIINLVKRNRAKNAQEAVPGSSP